MARRLRLYPRAWSQARCCRRWRFQKTSEKARAAVCALDRTVDRVVSFGVASLHDVDDGLLRLTLSQMTGFVSETINNGPPFSPFVPYPRRSVCCNPFIRAGFRPPATLSGFPFECVKLTVARKTGFFPVSTITPSQFLLKPQVFSVFSHHSSFSSLPGGGVYTPDNRSTIIVADISNMAGLPSIKLAPRLESGCLF